MSTYPTNDKTGADNLVAFALAVRSKCLELTATDGKLSDLTTSAKTNLVTAINELVTGLNTVNDIIAKKTEIDDTKSTTSNVWSASKTATEIATTATNLKNDLLGGAGEAYDTLKELADLINNNKTAIEALQEIASGHVKFNESQSLSDTQKATARSNIGASATVHTHTISAITGLQAELDTKALASSLAVVATSGSYNDLSNKPTKVSAFENDKGYLTAHQSLDAYATKASLASVATSGSYSDLLNKPTKVSVFDNDKGYLTEHQSLADYVKTSSLAKVATSGSYSDLSNTPTIPTVPTVVSAFTNDAGYLTTHQDLSAYAKTANLAKVATSGSYNDLGDKPTIPEGVVVDSALSTTSVNSVQNKVITNALSLKADTSAVTAKVSKTGDTMSGDLTFSGNCQITSETSGGGRVYIGTNAVTLESNNTGYENGSSLLLRSSTYGNGQAGHFYLSAGTSSSNRVVLEGDPDTKKLTWNSKEVLIGEISASQLADTIDLGSV